MDAGNEVERESLKDEMRNILEEARMVIPGAQALFGFQTMAVFNQRFTELPQQAVAAYVTGLALIALSVGLMMAPAAYHRIAERGQVSRKMIRRSTFLIAAGMVPLMFAIGIDLYVVFLAALGSEPIAMAAGCAGTLVLGALWYLYPWSCARHFTRPAPPPPPRS